MPVHVEPKKVNKDSRRPGSSGQLEVLIWQDSVAAAPPVASIGFVDDSSPPRSATEQADAAAAVRLGPHAAAAAAAAAAEKPQYQPMSRPGDADGHKKAQKEQTLKEPREQKEQKERPLEFQRGSASDRVSERSASVRASKEREAGGTGAVLVGASDILGGGSSSSSASSSRSSSPDDTLATQPYRDSSGKWHSGSTPPEKPRGTNGRGMSDVAVAPQHTLNSGLPAPSGPAGKKPLKRPISGRAKGGGFGGGQIWKTTPRVDEASLTNLKTKAGSTDGTDAVGLFAISSVKQASRAVVPPGGGGASAAAVKHQQLQTRRETLLACRQAEAALARSSKEENQERASTARKQLLLEQVMSDSTQAEPSMHERAMLLAGLDPASNGAGHAPGGRQPTPPDAGAAAKTQGAQSWRKPAIPRAACRAKAPKATPLQAMLARVSKRRPSMSESPLVVFSVDGCLADACSPLGAGFASGGSGASVDFDVKHCQQSQLHVRPGLILGLRSLLPAFQLALCTRMPPPQLKELLHLLDDASINVDAIYVAHGGDEHGAAGERRQSGWGRNGAGAANAVCDYSRVLSDFSIAPTDASKRMLVVSAINLAPEEVQSRSGRQLLFERARNNAAQPHFVSAVPAPLKDGADAPAMLLVPNPRNHDEFLAMHSLVLARHIYQLEHKEGWHRGFDLLQKAAGGEEEVERVVCFRAVGGSAAPSAQVGNAREDGGWFERSESDEQRQLQAREAHGDRRWSRYRFAAIRCANLDDERMPRYQLVSAKGDGAAKAKAKLAKLGSKGGKGKGTEQEQNQDEKASRAPIGESPIATRSVLLIGDDHACSGLISPKSQALI